MGILDDLRMGLGLEERTEDYDARTARTIAANEAAARRGDATNAMYLAQARNPSHSSYIGDDVRSSSAGARRFLDQTGGESYNPQVVADERSILERLIYSPESSPSPRPYAVGPLDLDGPIELPQFGLLGLFSRGMSNLFNRGDEGAERPDAVAPTRDRDVGFPMNNGQRETTFIENMSGVDMYDPATDYIEPDFSQVSPATTAAKEFAENKDFLDTVQSAIDMAESGQTPPLSNANFYDPTGAFGMREGTSSIRRMPNGKYVDILTGKVIF